MKEAIVFENLEGVLSPPLWIPGSVPHLDVALIRLPSLFDGDPDDYDVSRRIRYYRTEECVEIDSIAVTIYRQKELPF